MVKIIRLSTEETDGSFNTRFNAPVNIKPNSKIALQNLIMGVNLKTIVIDSTNDQIKFSVAGAGAGKIRTALLTRRIYTDNNALDLVADIQKQMNGALEYVSGKELGAMFRVTHASKITIQNDFGRSLDYERIWNSNIPLDSAGGNKVVVKTTGSQFNMNKSTSLNGGVASANNQSINFLDQEICKGTGYFRFRIHTLNDESADNNSGFIMGLVKGQPSDIITNGISTPTTFADSDIYFGMKISKRASTINTFSEGTFTATAHTPNSLGTYLGANDSRNATFEINIQKNKMQLVVYSNGGVSTVIGEKTIGVDGKPINIQTQGYSPVIIYRGGSTNVITTDHRFIQDPYTPLPNNIVETSENTDLSATAKPVQSGAGAGGLSNMFIEIVDPILARELGFVPRRLPSPAGTLLVKRLVFTASNDLSLIAINDNYMAVIDNVHLDSYDSLLKGHRPILAVIPSLDDTGVIRYDSNYPVFVDANNKSGISLKNIKMRIIRQDGSTVNSQGLSTATLLIQED